MLRRSFLLAVVALAMICSNAYGYDFWGLTMDTETYAGSQQLAFTGLAGSGIQYAVGGYRYTRVDSTWLGPFAAASPGASYPIHRQFDAMGLFFLPEAAAAKFMIITGMPQTGVSAASVGYGSRVIGPGDLKIDHNGNSYGVGLRLSNLPWAIDPNTTSPYFQVYKATGGVDNIHAGNAGTLGTIELNPRWDRVDNRDLPAYSQAAYAFFVSGSGTSAGSAAVAVANTGVTLGGAPVFAYEASVPWEVLGVGSGGVFDLKASWRPACGNDLIYGQFAGTVASAPPPPPDVPEVSTVILALSGLLGVAAARRRMG